MPPLSGIWQPWASPPAVLSLKGQRTTLALAQLPHLLSSGPLLGSSSHPTPHQTADALLLSAWEGQANTIWYSTDNTAKAQESSKHTHFARAALGLPSRESGRRPHHGSLSCLGARPVALDR